MDDVAMNQTGPMIDLDIPTRFGDAELGSRCDGDGRLNEAGDFRRFTFWDKTAKKTERMIIPLWNVGCLAEDFVHATMRDARARVVDSVALLSDECARHQKTHDLYQIAFVGLDKANDQLCDGRAGDAAVTTGKTLDAIHKATQSRPVRPEDSK